MGCTASKQKAPVVHPRAAQYDSYAGGSGSFGSMTKAKYITDAYGVRVLNPEYVAHQEARGVSRTTPISAV